MAAQENEDGTATLTLDLTLAGGEPANVEVTAPNFLAVLQVLRTLGQPDYLAQIAQRVMEEADEEGWEE